MINMAEGEHAGITQWTLWVHTAGCPLAYALQAACWQWIRGQNCLTLLWGFDRTGTEPFFASEPCAALPSIKKRLWGNGQRLAGSIYTARHYACWVETEQNASLPKNLPFDRASTGSRSIVSPPGKEISMVHEGRAGHAYTSTVT